VKIANERKIETLEIQHGVFDVAFQYGERILNDSRFTRTKTNHVLTFGPYFSDYVRSSSRPLNFGSYYLEEKSKKKVERPDSRKTILFVSQHRYTDAIIPVLEEALKRSKENLKLIIRLHPLEHEDTNRYLRLSTEFNGRFSTTEDIYDLILESDFVVGLFSTVLFECVYFGKVPFIFRNQLSEEFIPSDLGKWFHSPEELAMLITEGDPSESAKSDLYWAKDYQSNFSNYLQQLAIP